MLSSSGQAWAGQPQPKSSPKPACVSSVWNKGDGHAQKIIHTLAPTGNGNA